MVAIDTISKNYTIPEPTGVHNEVREGEVEGVQIAYALNLAMLYTFLKTKNGIGQI